jgi:predicted nucleic acid-binding protein
MIVLDTNVVSEAMKPEPHPSVRAWLNDQAAETLFLSSVTLAELLFGIAVLPAGKRKGMLAKALDGLMGLFRDRILPFDIDAPDGYIAAIAASRGFIVASRDTAPYEAAGVSILNPWEA